MKVEAVVTFLLDLEIWFGSAISTLLVLCTPHKNNYEK